MKNASELFTGAVLTGGGSTRMGRDKALIVVDGVALAVRTATVLRDAGASAVVAVGGDVDALVALGLDARTDLYPGEGPLGAILTAFDAASTDLVVVLACDLPSVDAATVRRLLETIADHAAAVPITDRAHPLCAVYRVSGCAALLGQALAAGERAVHRALEVVDVIRVDLPDPGVLRNVNRPGDLS
ncbi:MAG: molybdenum cofactor guanylyltransferase [Acidimicrobiales bacterium]